MKCASCFVLFFCGTGVQYMQPRRYVMAAHMRRKHAPLTHAAICANRAVESYTSARHQSQSPFAHFVTRTAERGCAGARTLRSSRAFPRPPASPSSPLLSRYAHTTPNPIVCEAPCRVPMALVNSAKTTLSSILRP